MSQTTQTLGTLFGDIADAIRAKNGSSTTYYPNQMATAISNIPTGGSINLQTKSISPDESSHIVFPDAGYDGLASVSVRAVSSSYVGSSITRQAAKTVNPSTSSQTAVATGVYTTGAVTVAAATLQTKTATDNGDVTPDSGYYGLSKVTVNVSGSGKAVQYYNGGDRVNVTSYTATDVTLTVAKAGTYTVMWSGFRNSTSSGTNGSRLYKNGTAVGSAFTSFTDSYWQAPKLTGQTFAKDDVLVIYARSRNTSSYMSVTNLIIIEE